MPTTIPGSLTPTGTRCCPPSPASLDVLRHLVYRGSGFGLVDAQVILVGELLLADPGGEGRGDAGYGDYTADTGNKLVVATITLKNTYSESVPMWGDDFAILTGCAPFFSVSTKFRRVFRPQTRQFIEFVKTMGNGEGRSRPQCPYSRSIPSGRRPPAYGGSLKLSTVFPRF